MNPFGISPFHVLPCCCNPPEANDFEAKEFHLKVPNPGYARFAGVGFSLNHYTGWTRTFYLTKRIESVDADGNEAWGQTDIDIDNASPATDGYTPSGMGTPDGFPTFSYFGDTHVRVVYTNGFTIDEYLSNPYDLGDLIDTWQARLDALIDTLVMNDPLDFTHRASDGGSNITRTLEWPSLIAGSSTKFNTIELKPNSGYTWDSTYYFSLLVASTEDFVHPGRWTNLYEAPYASNLGSNGSVTYDSGISKFRLGRPTVIYLTKSIYSFPSGAVCGLSGWDASTNYNFGDMIYGSVDLDTGIITDTAAELQLSRGIFGFDIGQIHPYSGHVISRIGSFPAYGAIRPRATLPTPRTDWNQYADWC